MPMSNTPTSTAIRTVSSDVDTVIAANAFRAGISIQNQSERELRVRELRNEPDVAAGTAAGTVGEVLAATSAGNLGDGGFFYRSTKKAVAVRFLGAGGFTGPVCVTEED